MSTATAEARARYGADDHPCCVCRPRGVSFFHAGSQSPGDRYFAELIPVGMVTEAFPDGGIGFSFATDHPEGFGNDDLQLIEAVLPAVSLAIVSDAEHTIAAGLLAAYLGSDVGRRVHAGVVERGSVESIRAVLWYADIRGFTPIADATPGPVLVEMLDDVFETLTAALRPHGGEVLKFLGDGMLASFAFVAATRDETCSHALAAATEAMCGLDRLNADRARMGKPIATVDLALHLGEVLYGNVGAMDRLDFTVIGPAVNEVARIETLCELLGRRVLVSAELAAAAGNRNRLEPLGVHLLRGVRQAKEILLCGSRERCLGGKVTRTCYIATLSPRPTSTLEFLESGRPPLHIGAAVDARRPAIWANVLRMWARLCLAGKDCDALPLRPNDLLDHLVNNRHHFCCREGS